MKAKDCAIGGTDISGAMLRRELDTNGKVWIYLVRSDFMC